MYEKNDYLKNNPGLSVYMSVIIQEQTPKSRQKIKHIDNNCKKALNKSAVELNRKTCMLSDN